MKVDNLIITNEYKDTCIDILQENLVALRSKAKLSQEKLAVLIGVSRQTYYGFETRKNKMSWSIYIALMFYFSNMDATKEMLNDIKIYPIELILNLNNSL